MKIDGETIISHSNWSFMENVLVFSQERTTAKEVIDKMNEFHSGDD